jgi:hypothetical protein
MNHPKINQRNATHFIEAFLTDLGDVKYTKVLPISHLNSSLLATIWVHFTTHHIFLITIK